MISRNKIRELELSWNVKNPENGDWVALYEEDPLRNNDAVPIFKTSVNNLKWCRTNILERRDFAVVPLFNSTCLGYWTAYWRRTENKYTILTSSCLRSFPTWMENLRSHIGNLKLKDLFIPGTHDSAAYLVSYNPFEESSFQKFVYNQDENVFNQLAMGARYLDIRIGISKGEFWAYHGSAVLHPLSSILDQIKFFMDKTNEIVIVDIHRFPVGFKNGNDHELLVKYLMEKLGNYMAENYMSWNSRLRDIWLNKKRLIVSYNNNEMVSKYKRLLWPPVSQKWADTQNPENLYSYLKQFMNENKPSYLWAAMAELTPSTWSFFRYRKGLREMADKINKDVTSWFRGGWGRYCNVVAVDFLRSTSIVSAAIKWNKCRGTNH